MHATLKTPKEPTLAQMHTISGYGMLNKRLGRPGLFFNIPFPEFVCIWARVGSFGVFKVACTCYVWVFSHLKEVVLESE